MLPEYVKATLTATTKARWQAIARQYTGEQLGVFLENTRGPNALKTARKSGRIFLGLTDRGAQAVVFVPTGAGKISKYYTSLMLSLIHI